MLTLQGCGSVLATQNLESISFEYSTHQRSSSSQPFIKPRLIARPAHSLLPNMPHAETPQQTCHEREQGVQSDGGLQRPNSHLDEHPCGQQSKAVNGHNSGQPNGQPSRHLYGQANGQPSQHDGSAPATEQAGLQSDISQTRSNTDSGAVCNDREEASLNKLTKRLVTLRHCHRTAHSKYTTCPAIAQCHLDSITMKKRHCSIGCNSCTCAILPLERWPTCTVSLALSLSRLM